MSNNYYSVLQIQNDATIQQIKNAFRKLSMLYHPDLAKFQKSFSQQKFKQINQAYRVLSDTVLRLKHDKSLKHRNEKMTSGVFILPRKGSDIHISMNATIQQIAEGINRTVTYFQKKVCLCCYGTGSRKMIQQIVCNTCKGLGSLSTGICYSCDGQGFIKKDNDRCQCCGGFGFTDQQCTVDIQSQNGDFGQFLLFAFQGNEGLFGGPNGNLTINVNPNAHEKFQLDSKGNLHLNYYITYHQAFCGCIKEISTISDQVVEVVLPPRTLQTIIELKGYGVHCKSANRDKSSMFVKFIIHHPQTLTQQQINALKLLGNYADNKNITVKRRQ